MYGLECMVWRLVCLCLRGFSARVVRVSKF